MKRKRGLGIFLMLVCLLLGCQPVWAQEGSTAITVTVPEREKTEAAGVETPDEVPRQEGGYEKTAAGDAVTAAAAADAEAAMAAADAADAMPGTGQSAGAGTGDETNVTGWATAMLMSMAFAVTCIIRKKKRNS